MIIGPETGKKYFAETAMALWRGNLLSGEHAPVTVNSILAALNGYLRFAGE